MLQIIAVVLWLYGRLRFVKQHTAVETAVALGIGIGCFYFATTFDELFFYFRRRKKGFSLKELSDYSGTDGDSHRSAGESDVPVIYNFISREFI